MRRMLHMGGTPDSARELALQLDEGGVDPAELPGREERSHV
jgi:hypothetical protein